MKYLKMLRIKQYIKNLFVFVPLFFSASFNDLHNINTTVFVFLEFCFISSCIYIINDIVDLENDRKHPKKKNRPIASGEISVKTAKIIAIVLMVFALFFAYISKKYYSLIVISIYFILNLAYSFVLKRIVLVDVFTISLGFLARVYAGAFAIDVKVSNWLLLTTLALSLFLAFGKRYGEKKNSDDNSSRYVLANYNLESLKLYLVITMTLTIVFYSLYCAMGSGVLGDQGIVTVPIVMFAMFRYFMILEKEDGDPTNLIFNDKVVGLCIILYIVVAIILVWK